MSWEPTFGQAVADDAEALAALHDRELSPEILAALREVGFPHSLGLLPQTPQAMAAWQAMQQAIANLPDEPDPVLWDEIAAEYAAVYLNHAYGASPLESVWLDDDHLTCQEAMFELRRIYASAGLAARNWRQRPDDHLVLQLLYLAHVARTALTAEDWRAIANFLDEHLLRWIDDFATRLAARGRGPFYPELAVLTAAWLNTLRDMLARQLGEPRPTRAEIEARLKPADKPVEQPLTFLPGADGPSW